MEIQSKTAAGKRKHGEMMLTVAGGIFTAILSAILGPLALGLLKGDTAHTHETDAYIFLLAFACVAALYLMKVAFEHIDNAEIKELSDTHPSLQDKRSHTPNETNPNIIIEHGATKITIRIE